MAARSHWSRWALALLGLPLLLAPLAPATAAAQAQAAGPTVTLARLWNQGGTAGSWTPYIVTIRNEGSGGFTGTVVLVADSGYRAGPPTVYPEYREAVAVPAGGQRALTVYALEPSNGYRAELRTDDGRLLATATPASGGGSGPAVAIVSDVARAEQRVDALLRSESQLNAAVAGLGGGQAFPTSVIRLSGLNAIVLDQADSGALDEDQRRALLDFVGLGGTLIEAGGAGARRTTAFLPAQLVPLRPTGTADVSLSSLGELGGVATAQTAQVATGDVAAGARVGLVAADGTPLIVEGSYGAGEVVALAFDPLAAPFDGELDLGATAWIQALTRGLSGAQGAGSAQLTRLAFGGGAPTGGPIGSGPGAASGFQFYLGQVLADAPAIGSPPLGLLAALLALYVLVVSGVAYAVLKAVGRRGLLWVAVPAAAIVCTAGAYAVGFGTRGTDYQVAQVQVLRLAPGGVVETSSIDGILSPRRGDISVTTPAGSLVTTATPFLGPFQTGDQGAAQITIAGSTEVAFSNVAVWDMRPVQTLTVTHAGDDPGSTMPIDAQVGIRSGRLVGQVVNHTSRAVRNLQLISPTGARATLVPELAAGASVTIDAPVAQGAPGLPVTKGVSGPVAIGPGAGPVPPQNGAEAMVAMAASAVAVRPGEWALVGEVATVDTLRVGGQRPARQGRAMVTEPVRLQFADSATVGAAPARMVGTYSAGGGVVEVYEQLLPSGLTGRVALSTVVAAGPSSPTVTSVEVYDWDQHTWRALRGTGAALPSGALAAGETRNGVVRARVTSSTPGQVGIGVGDAS
jgi:hypothetical protein